MQFRYNAAKNHTLTQERGVSFEEIIVEIESGNVLRITPHHNQSKYPNQKVMHVKYLNKIYLIPYVTEDDGTLFLKTLYPCRKMTKLLL